MKKMLACSLALVCCKTALIAQAPNSDNAYKEPLKQVLSEVENRFQVKVTYSADMVKDKWVNYAEWRFRTDADQTLKNVLAPLDMTVNKTGDKTYKLKNFEYHLKTVEDGKKQLDYLSTLYSDEAGWEKRKNELKVCMLQALRLSPLPPRPASKPIVTGFRKMNGYTIEMLPLKRCRAYTFADLCTARQSKREDTCGAEP